MGDTEIHNLRGSIVTPFGERIPMRVSLLPARSDGAYTHIGQVEIPVAWIEEFEENISDFHFWSEDGECFNQIQVLDEVASTGGDASKEGRIILLRDRGASTFDLDEQTAIAMAADLAPIAERD